MQLDEHLKLKTERDCFFENTSFQKCNYKNKTARNYIKHILTHQDQSFKIAKFRLNDIIEAEENSCLNNLLEMETEKDNQPPLTGRQEQARTKA